MVMSAGGAAAEHKVGSGAWEGVISAIGGGTSLRGASTPECHESCTFSAGGCADSHKQTYTGRCKLH